MSDTSAAVIRGRKQEVDDYFKIELPGYLSGEKTCETHVSNIVFRQAKVGVQCGNKEPMIREFISTIEDDTWGKKLAALLRGSLRQGMNGAGFIYERNRNEYNEIYRK